MNLVPNFAGQDERFTRALDLLRDGIAARAFPGCALTVIYRGQLVASKGLGRFTYDPQALPVMAETIFDLASLTKIVATTAMAMILYERGLLDLDLPVTSLMREFPGDDPRRREVTVRMLLAHTSGLPAYLRLFETAGTRELLLLAACRAPLAHPPGKRTDYSDIGFIILGEALARLADEPLDTFCRREIFGPLGMTNTCFNPPPELRPHIPPTGQDPDFRHRVIQGEVNDENAFVMGGVAGHAGVFSSAVDLSSFALSLLHPGNGVFRPETLRVFGQPQPAGGGNPRALGFDLPSQPSQSGRYFSPGSLGHLGFTGSSLWVDRERDLAVTLLTNRTWPDRSSQEIKRIRPACHDAVLEALS